MDFMEEKFEINLAKSSFLAKKLDFYILLCYHNTKVKFIDN